MAFSTLDARGRSRCAVAATAPYPSPSAVRGTSQISVLVPRFLASGERGTTDTLEMHAIMDGVHPFPSTGQCTTIRLGHQERIDMNVPVFPSLRQVLLEDHACRPGDEKRYMPQKCSIGGWGRPTYGVLGSPFQHARQGFRETIAATCNSCCPNLQAFL